MLKFRSQHSCSISFSCSLLCDWPALIFLFQTLSEFYRVLLPAPLVQPPVSPSLIFGLQEKIIIIIKILIKKKNTPHLSELPRPVGFESLPSFSMNVFCSFNCSSLILSNSFFFPPFFLSLFLSLLKNPQIDDIRALKVPEGLAQTFVFFPDFSRPLSYLFISNRKRANRKL